MNAIQEVKDESIRKVAQTLRASGLAMSETEAVRMATMMSRTSQKVTQNFDSKKNGATMSTHFNEGSNNSSNSFATPTHINASSSVQEKPRKIEEKEEFIFGDIQEQSNAQKKDVYSMDNEFEEVVAQDIIGVKPVEKHIEEKPIAAPVHARPTPVTITTSPISSQGSSQMAFSFMLGEAQKNAAYEEEIRKHTPQPAAPTAQARPAMPVHAAPVSAPTKPAPAYNHNPRPFPQPVPKATVQRPVVEAPDKSSLRLPVEVQTEPKQAAVPVQASVTSPAPVQARPVMPVRAPVGVAASPVSPQKKMMQEANVDLSKMFNFNK